MRREFSTSVRRDALERAAGLCECARLAEAGIPGFSASGCGCALGPGNTFFEHIICDGAGGEPTLENCAVLTKTCWAAKTNTYDKGKVAKTKRQRDMRFRARLPTGRPMMGTKRSGWKKPLYGPAERR